MQTSVQIAPHYDQFFGFWAMEEARFWSEFNQVKQLNLHLHLGGQAVAEAQAVASQGSSFDRAGKIAIIGLHGKLMKQQASLSNSTSTVMVRRQVRAAARDPDIAAIMLHIDSPGGTVAGTEDLADDIAAAAASKPVHAYVEDLCASAAYWEASQALHISANAGSLSPSIGTYGVVYDMSGAAAMEGVKAHVVRAGAYKGAGTPGTEVTQEQLAEMQRNIDALNERFLLAVSRGRRMEMSRVRELADGRVHIAEESKRLGLIDAVESFDAALSRLADAAQSQSRRKPMSMNNHVVPDATHVTPEATGGDEQPPMAKVVGTLQPPAASAGSYNEIKQGCAGADAAFICSQLEAAATLAQAQAAWMAEQNQRIESANEQARQAAAKKPGVQPIGSKEQTSSGYDGDPVATFNGKVSERMQAGMSRTNAIQATAKADPELHAAYLMATNSSKKAQRMISEKFE